MTIPITGWAIRRFSGKTMGGTSLVLFIAGSVLCGAAWPVGSLIVFPVLQAARKAGPQRIGRVMSLIALPMLVGPVLGGLLIDDLAWR